LERSDFGRAKVSPEKRKVGNWGYSWSRHGGLTEGLRLREVKKFGCIERKPFESLQGEKASHRGTVRKRAQDRYRHTRRGAKVVKAVSQLGGCGKKKGKTEQKR